MLQNALHDDVHVTSYRHREVDTRRTAHIAQDIKDGKFEQVWISTPPTRIIRRQKLHSHMTRLTQWLRLAATAATLFFIVGPLNGQWHEPLMQSLMSDVEGNLRYYYFCQFGKSVNPFPDGTLSSARVVCFTNASIASRPCICDSSIPHVQDWSINSQSIRPGQKRQELVTHIARHIFGQTSLCQSSVDIGSEVNSSVMQSHTNKPTARRNNHEPVPDRGPGNRRTGYIPTEQNNDNEINDKQNSNQRTDKTNNLQSTYPTEARIRQKKADQERKEAGLEPKKRKRFLEDHCEDCGDSLKGLSHLDDEVPNEYFHCLPDSEDDEMVESQNATAGLEYLFLGEPSTLPKSSVPQGAQDSGIGNDPDTDTAEYMQVDNMEEFLATASMKPAGLDIIQICGGHGLLGRIALWRRLRTGQNFEIDWI